jgi:hypothetical protein
MLHSGTFGAVQRSSHIVTSCAVGLVIMSSQAMPAAGCKDVAVCRTLFFTVCIHVCLSLKTKTDLQSSQHMHSAVQLHRGAQV